MPSDPSTEPDRQVEARHPTSAVRAARVVGWFSLGMGAVQVAVPGRVGRLLGLPDAPAARTLVRATGVRELAVGLALLNDARPARWLWVRAAGDALDAALGGAAVAGGQVPDRGRTAVGAASAIAAGAADTAMAAWVGRNQPSEDVRPDRERRVATSITVNRPLDEVSAAWRDLARLPSFMHHLESVEVQEDGRTRWTARAPLGRTVSWDARVITETPQLVAWESEGGMVRTSGSVRFVPAPGGRGTEVHVVVRYAVPAAALADKVARAAGESPRQQVHDDLRRFKQVMETGEVPVSEGSPAGTVARDQALQRPAQPAERTTSPHA